MNFASYSNYATPKIIRRKIFNYIGRRSAGIYSLLNIVELSTSESVTQSNYVYVSIFNNDQATLTKMNQQKFRSIISEMCEKLAVMLSK